MYEIQFRGTLDGEDVMNALHYAYVGSPNLGDLTTAVVSAAIVMSTDWFPHLPNNFVGRGEYGHDLSVAAAIQYTDLTNAGSVGTDTGDPLPNEVTLAVARKSGLTGRSSNGRIYWCGLSDSQVVDNTVSVTPAADIVAAIEAVDAAVVAAVPSLVPCIVSRYTGGAPRVSGVFVPIATWAVTDRVVDSRRSRKP